ncbi:STAS domain-containing protein [Mycoavidus sp. HKI]|uniref:STAS domain-containing protein n=1 Tax=Mycoavidus sp. HKI TaxID=2840467 RepID=UPI001CC07C5E|nr:STAS domain-containing protein [Mycoavidus sp. HKI]UAW64378.1 STAS domain-containing protein [Mycoavidus sp. HKI]
MAVFSTGTALTHVSAMAELEAGLAYITTNSAEAVRIDCTSVARFDSSALAVLLAWFRAAQVRGKTLEVLNLPAKLKSLARAYGVDELLKL